MAIHFNNTVLKAGGGFATGGFVTNADYFLRGYNKLLEAKESLNRCKQLFNVFNLDYALYKTMKADVNNCKISSLVNLVESTKNNLMKVDKEFSDRYTQLLQESLQNIDFSSMSEDEIMQYNIMTQNYEKTMLTMYQKLSSLGCLSKEEQQYYDYLKLKNEQYDIQDKMSVLDPRSEEYINYFKENAKIDIELIKINNSLSDEEKEQVLSEYSKKYNENLQNLQNSRNTMLHIESLKKELNDLYQEKENNSNIFHPCIEKELNALILDKEIELGKLSGQDVSDKEEYKNMSGFDRFFADTKTFAASTYTGLFDIVESVVDGLAMTTSVTWGTALNLVGVDGYNKAISAFVSKDYASELYDGIVLSSGMNTTSAYGDVYMSGMVFGKTIGHVGLSFLSPWVNAFVGAAEGMGSTSESVLSSGGSYLEAIGRGGLSAIGGAFSGYGMSSMNSSITQFIQSGALKTIGSTVGNMIKDSGVKSLITGTWNIVKSNGKTIGKSVLSSLADVDTFVETGCVFFDNIFCGLADGNIDWETTLKQTAAVFGTECVMNLLMGVSANIGLSALDVDVTEKIFDVDATEKIFDVDATEKMFDVNTTARLSLLDSNTNGKLQEFIYTMCSSGSSESAMDMFYISLYKSLDKGNIDALKMLDKIIDLKKNNPDFKIILYDDPLLPTSYWSKNKNIVVIDSKTYNNNDVSTVIHEIGHCLFDSVLDGRLPDKWEDIIQKARNNFAFGSGKTKYENALKEADYYAYDKGFNEFKKILLNRGMNIQDYEDNITNYYESVFASYGTDFVSSRLKGLGFSDELIKNLLDNGITAREMAVKQIDGEIWRYRSCVYVNERNGMACISDIVDATHLGERQDVAGNVFNVSFQHGLAYYNNNNKLLSSFHEIIANYSSMKINGDSASILMLKDLFGEEFVDSVENIFQRMIQ